MFEEELKKLVELALEKDEVPVAALLVKDGEIVSKAFNMVETENNITNHAEIMAITKYTREKGNWRLNDYDLYVTLEPCEMCREVIKNSRIKNVYYYVSRETLNGKCDGNCLKIDNSYSQLFKEVLVDFFKRKRDKSEIS